MNFFRFLAFSHQISNNSPLLNNQIFDIFLIHFIQFTIIYLTKLT